ncbi:putative protease with the C-terminal PDZ domain [Bernardetia litoralis DSM 6794]|uniref:Putative protease with the C-terminal PDZ domain n=1 Tax=Bernardetia litoralis (strain ATCC 23117 / DSM 6794 / NBRC 15988 / NCIMB 1366 / Fx l1 / Sio-4) TaxID=880071 RepID=I4AN66_BERLS|nr:protease with the C-terminal PDZ domain [Bernardetia litoralis]AFM05401.1 putative protease with the C-terminal PDZ domain [Bernardetia litoralis DSM 6794]
MKILSFSSKFVFFLFVFSFSLNSIFAQQNNEIEKSDKTAILYSYQLDLTKSKDDKVPVELLLKDLATFKASSETLKGDSISFFMPKIVPGTYHIYDFGRFLSDFKVLDKEGNEIGFTHPNENEWRFPAKNVYKITYLVDDTFDSKEENKVFEPGGTDIEDEVFVINTHGFFGYLEGLKRQPFEINVLKPSKFYGSTPLVAAKSDEEKDTYLVSDYHLLADSPMLYCIPDTVTFEVGGAEILVSVFHEKGTVKVNEVAKEVQKSLEAQKNYLGGTLPIKKYAFLIYIFDGFSNSGSYGALEHSYSSLYFLPNIGASRLANTVVEIAAHEFFHILTPLSIHSEQIHYFDFINPKMSKHLWLYEGVTEYFANHVLLQQGLISLDEFLDAMRGKVSEANNYSDVPFTEMSLGCLDEYADEYGNVYEKGALIGWMLDIRLRELSEGKYGLMNLMQDLSKKYGTEQPFEDDKLFDVITEMTYPEIRTFFVDYVEGSKELPYINYLKTIGINTTGEGTEEVFNFGNIGLAVDPETKEVSVFSMEGANEFGKIFKEGDILLEINGKKTDAANFLDLISEASYNENDEMKILVNRKKGKKNKLKKTLLKSKPVFVEQEQDFGFEEIQDKNKKQIKLLKAWEKWDIK